MIRFESKTMNGEVAIGFRHQLPRVEVGPQNNRLASIEVRVLNGQTECILETPAGNFFGMAYTHPQDQYKKEVGRELSLKRAIEAAAADGYINEAAAREILSGYYGR